MFRTIKSYIANFIGVVAGIIGIQQAGSSYLSRFSNETTIAVVFLCLMMLYYFSLHVFRNGAAQRKVKYAEVLDELYICNQYLHLLNVANANTALEFFHGFENFCNSMARALTFTTGTPCYVSIKIVEKYESVDNEKRFSFQTLTRCEKSKNKRLPLDEQGREKGVIHDIDMNTAFKVAYSSPERFYFQNYLPFTRNFISTQFDVHGKKPESNLLMRWHRWPLNYRSGIVIAISLPPTTQKPSPRIIGFLCVDSEKMGVFHRKYDLFLLMGGAVALYNTVSRFKEII